MKNILIGLWLTLVALGAAFGAALMALSTSHADAHAENSMLHSEKTRTINVPIIAEGVLQGYVGMQFTYVTEGAATKTSNVSPEVYLLNAAFNDVYMDVATDFRHLDKVDLPAFTKRLVADTNAHIGAPVIKDVLIESFNYIPRDVQSN